MIFSLIAKALKAVAGPLTWGVHPIVRGGQMRQCLWVKIMNASGQFVVARLNIAAIPLEDSRILRQQ
jgi:hypothetical protein